MESDNKLFKIEFSKKQLLAGITLLMGVLAIALGIYLISQTQVFRPKASQNIYSAFEITQVDEDGVERPVTCSGNNCTTESLEINFKIKDLEKLIE